jgi:hypothetical protein
VGSAQLKMLAHGCCPLAQICMCGC